ncbi:hypothetical protein PROFUN_03767 [Planoprotostelium fungivorum]|uniref:Uncharacterized protein n=1 Tax=Planoprotostelium fungivorum TaxID=1890364 RepID=A0A2P6NDP7_9EUKA|nr:hypothetical protein PROFUN_03767 [Planoprotostelium fungivorum]
MCGTCQLYCERSASFIPAAQPYRAQQLMKPLTVSARADGLGRRNLYETSTDLGRQAYVRATRAERQRETMTLEFVISGSLP